MSSSMVNDSVYIASQNNPLYIFNKKTGKYLNQIGSIGTGPDQYSFIVDFRISSKLIIIFDTIQFRLLFYSKNGKHLATRNIPEVLIGHSIKTFFYNENNKTIYFVSDSVIKELPYHILGYQLNFTNYSFTLKQKFINSSNKLTPYMPFIERGVSDGNAYYSSKNATITTALPYIGEIYEVNTNTGSIKQIVNNKPPFFKKAEPWDQKEEAKSRTKSLDWINAIQRKSTATNAILPYKDRFFIKMYGVFPRPDEPIYQSFIVVEDTYHNKSYYGEEVHQNRIFVPDLIKDDVMYKLDMRPVFIASIEKKVANPTLRTIHLSDEVFQE